VTHRPTTASRVVGLAEAVRLRAAWRAAGERVVLADGVFDLLHAGHARYLEEARKLGARLVVAVEGDARARAADPTGPVLVATDRARLVTALRGVDAVVVLGSEPEDVVTRTLAPDVWVRGSDDAGGRAGVASEETVFLNDEGTPASRALVARIRASRSGSG